VPYCGRFFAGGGRNNYVFREHGIDRLTNSDLAALLDSHIGLLSVFGEGSGAIFLAKTGGGQNFAPKVMFNRDGCGILDRISSQKKRYAK